MIRPESFRIFRGSRAVREPLLNKGEIRTILLAFS